MTKNQIIELGIKKRNGEINQSWSELVDKYNLQNDGFCNGEQLRSFIKRNVIKSENHIRILHISDLHYPFNLGVKSFSKYKNKIDILEINGDEEDCQSISKYRKKYRVPFVDEMVGTRQMLIDIIEYINPKKVYLNYGNHNIRFINYFSDKLCDDLLSLMPETNLDLIVDNGFWKYDHENKTRTFYEPIKNIFSKIDVEYTHSWYNQIGSTVFAHPSAYKSGILATTDKARIYFYERGLRFDTMVLAHTHKVGFAKVGNVYLFESGALCKEPEYQIDGKMNKPSSNGFIYLEQDENGKLIYDKCKIECL